MKYLGGNYYEEVKDHRYRLHQFEYLLLRKPAPRDPPHSPSTQYQVQNETPIRKNQKVIKNDNDQLVVKNYPRKKLPNFQQPKFKPTICPSCKQ